MRGISWLAAKPVSFSKRTLLHAVSKWLILSVPMDSLYFFTSNEQFAHQKWVLPLCPVMMNKKQQFNVLRGQPQFLPTPPRWFDSPLEPRPPSFSIFRDDSQFRYAPHSVGLLWTSDRSVAETSSSQHTALTRYIHVPGRIRTRNHINRAATGRTVFYVVGSKSFRPDRLFKVTEIKQIRCFST